MPDNFNNKMRKIVEQIDPQFRAQAENDLSMLQNRGVSTYNELIAILQDKNITTRIRAIACWFLARLGDKRSLSAILACLQDGDSNLRSEAARSLGILNSKKATPFLIKSLRKDTNAEVRMYAAYAFGSLHDKRALEPLIETLNDIEENPKVRGMAAETLGSMYDERAIQPLIEALSDRSVEVRYWSAFALGELGAVQALPELERLLNEDNESLLGLGSVKQEANAAIKAIQSSLNAE